MATGKNSFILYADYKNIFKELTDQEAGKLIKHLFCYVNDENPVMDDRLLKIVFEPIKQQLKRDLKDWEDTKSKKSESGRLGNLKRWNNDLWKKVIKYEITLEEAENVAVNRKTSQCDNPIANIAVTDTVNVNDTVTDSKKELLKTEKFLIPEMQKVFKKENKNYFADNKKDFEPLQKISGYISQIYNLPENVLSQSEDDKKEICRRWGELVEFISKDDFYRNYSLMQIEKHFQSIISKQKNGNEHSGHTNSSKKRFEITGTGGY